jgi:hypothetical protein
MPRNQPIEILVSRRRSDAVQVVPATYVGDAVPGTDDAPRGLAADERALVRTASERVALALAGLPVDELHLHDAVETLHRFASLVEGEPRLRIADGRVIGGTQVSFRPRFD